MRLLPKLIKGFVFVQVLACTLLYWHAAQAADALKRPNVVFILADDLGYTDVATYGSKYYETPNIDRLAEQGVKFTNGYTCGPNCQPTRAALHSGQYNPRTGVYTVGGIDRFPWQTRSLRPVDNVVQLPLDKITLAQTLKKSGYVTGMFGKWHLGNDAEHHPSQRGFDEAIVSQGQHFNFNTNPQTEHDKDAYLADFLTDKAVDFIRRHQDEPFFLYVPHFGVHAPHDAKPALVEKFKNKPGVAGHKSPEYAAMIASVDESVGRITALLEELKLADNTLVIFTSDNGGVGGYEREGIQGGSITDNAPLQGGKGMLYEGGIRVPFIFRWTGKTAVGAVAETPINSVDLYPTLLEVTGSAAPANYPLDGESYAALLSKPQEARLKRDALYWHFPGYLGAGGGTWRTTPAGAIRVGDWKLIEFFEDGHLELYNLKNDLGERDNLATKEPAKAKELHERLVAWRKETGAKLPTKNTPSDDAPANNKGKNKQKKKKQQSQDD